MSYFIEGDIIHGHLNTKIALEKPENFEKMKLLAAIFAKGLSFE